MTDKSRSLAGTRTLIVEDEALIAEEIGTRLSNLGLHPIDIVESGEGALEATLQHDPELVLMDIRLKGNMDGIEAANRIRETTGAPIVFLTAHSDTDTVNRAVGASPYAYLLKPCTERELLIAIRLTLHQHEIERKLRQSERRFAATLASIADAVLTTDESGRVSLMNRKAALLTGRSPEVSIGSELGDVFPIRAELPRMEIAPPLTVLEGKLHLEDQGLLKRADGESIPVEYSSARIRDDDETLGCVLAFRDLRQRRAAERALRETEERLAQAEKMEAIGRIAARIAHDFNNVLTVTTGTFEELREFHVDTPQERLIREVDSACARGKDLTRQLGELGRTEPFDVERLELQRVLRDCEGALRRCLGGRAKLELHVDEATRAIAADRTQLEQILLNLTANARDAMPVGGVLRVVCTNESVGEGEAARELVKIVFRDTGRGMEDSVRTRAFEPYFTTKGRSGGSGLGLASVYAIVTQSGGRVEIESVLGRGTDVIVRFPVCPEES